VIKPETVKGFMEENYNDKYVPRNLKKDDVFIQGSNFKMNKVFIVIIHNEYVFYCKKTNDGYKIDWLGSEGFNKVSLKTFDAIKEPKPTEFRITASISANYPYKNQIYYKENYWSADIRSNNDNYHSIYGCLFDKNTEDGKKIFKILEDGKMHNLIIEIKNSTEDNLVKITKLISNSWSIE
jgi:hypothetical protein